MGYMVRCLHQTNRYILFDSIVFHIDHCNIAYPYTHMQYKDIHYYFSMYI